MSATVRRCPVCWQIAIATPKLRVTRHRDSIGRDVCPMSNEDYLLTEITRPFSNPRRRRTTKLRLVS